MGNLIRRLTCFILIIPTISLLFPLPGAMAQGYQDRVTHKDYRAGGIHQSSGFSGAGVELTPFAGYTFGGSFEEVDTFTGLDVKESESYGIIIDVPNGYDTQFQFFFSHQPTLLKISDGPFSGDPLFDLDIEYFHFGGTYAPNNDNLNFYVSGGVGLTHISPESGDSETNFSLSLGAGFKLFLTDHLGLRIEGRGFGTYYNGSNSIFCNNGNCTIWISGDMLWQFTVFSGLILRF